MEFIAEYRSNGWVSTPVSAATLTITLIPSLEIDRVFKAYGYMT
ncbi:MAG: hypothetical protein RMI56_02940 [Sulfolobales archaeon]|nr:hypothetical protein [Sulfolobales archaeon]MDW8082736.1 hypothetical protein [Sulfolobales archaeon]